MTENELEYDVIEAILSKLLKAHDKKFKWENDNTIVFTEDKKEFGKIILNDKKVTVTGKIEKEFNALLKVIKNAEKKLVKADDVKDTPFEGMFNHLQSYGGIEKVPDLFKQILAKIKRLGIDKVVMGNSMLQNQTIKNKLTLGFSISPDSCSRSQESGYFSRLKTFLYDTYKPPFTSKSAMPLSEISKFDSLEGEKIIELEVQGMHIGHYYPERNFININFNPFLLSKYSVFETDLPLLFEHLFGVLATVKVKTHDISDMQEKIFVSEYLGKSRQKIISCEEQMKSYERDIKSYEQKIRTNIEGYQEKAQEIEFITQLVKAGGKGLFAEVKRIDTLPFVEKVDIEGTTIDIKYKKTFIPIPDMMRNDGGKRYGKRYIYIGQVGFRITPGGFEVYGDVNVGNGHCHPHGGGFPSGSPCFGSGDGRNKIYDLLASNKFFDLAKMLWFWIKTYKNSGAYVHVWTAYDNALKNGYPVFDDKGNRIEINEPARIKSGEQEKLEKSDIYAKNKKAFATSKLDN